MSIIASRSGRALLPFAIGLLVALFSMIGLSQAATETLSLEIGGGTMLPIEAPASAIYVADPEVADIQLRSPRLMHLFGKSVGETMLYVIGGNDEIVLERRIVVGLNITRLEEVIKLVRPAETVAVTSFANSVLLTGHLSSAEAAADVQQLAARVVGDNGTVINHMRVSSPSQVNLRVRIAEVSRDISKQLGFSWDFVKQAGEFALGVATGGFNGLAAATGSTLFSLADSGGSLNVNALIDALDNQGLITVLAEPNLTALSGESANFLVGGEFPIPVPQEDGAITIVFKQFGVGLSFVPAVLDDGQLHIQVRAEVSQLSDAGALQFNGFTVPALTTRQAETTVKLGSGQSFAIAGLLQNTTNQGVNRTPGLGELPVLGTLFRSNAFQRQESELVVIVTPYLVRPSSGRLVSPTDGFQPASDFARNLHGDMHRTTGQAGGAGPLTRDGREGLVGEAGFVLR